VTITAVPPPSQRTPGTGLVQGLRRSTAELRQALITSAAGAFARRGYGGATTKEIAEGANTDEKTIYRHFGSKADLFTAAVVQPFVGMLDDYTVAFQRELAAGDESRVILAWVELLYDHLNDNRDAVLALISSTGDPEAAEAVSMAIDKMDTMFDDLWGLSEKLKASGGRFRAEPGQLWSRLITGMLISATALETVVLSRQAEQHRREQILKTVSQLLLHGVFE